jgi:hypothetical protein
MNTAASWILDFASWILERTSRPRFSTFLFPRCLFRSVVFFEHNTSNTTSKSTIGSSLRAAIMEEAFFEPCSRIHDLIRAENGHFLFPVDVAFEEVELRAGVGNGAYDLFHHPDFTFEDF